MSTRPPVSFLERLSDVDLTSPADGEALLYSSGVAKWTNLAVPGGQLATLTDVVIVTPLDGQLLRYNSASSKWVNYGPLAFTDITGNISVSQMSNGASAANNTYFRGDGIWAPIPAAGTIPATASVLIGDGVGNASAPSPIITTSTAGLHSEGANNADFLVDWWNTTAGVSATAGLQLKSFDGYAQVKLLGSSNTGSGIVTPNDLWIRNLMSPSGPKKANVIISTNGDQVLFSNNDGVTLRALIGGGLAVGTITDPGAGLINVLTGFKVNNAAVSGTILKGNGTNYVPSNETYAAPGAIGNVMRSDGTNWTSAAPGAGGTVTSITATSPILASTNPIIATGTLSFATNVDLALTTAQSITQSTAATNTVVNGLSLTENSTGTAANGLGTGIAFKAESSTTNSQDQASIQSAWSDVTHATRTAYLDFLVANNPGTVASRMRLFGLGNLSVGNTTDPGGSGGIIIANTGYRIGTGTSTSGKILKSNGTNFVASTETFPTNPGSSGNLLTSDGTNWLSAAPSSLTYINASLATQAPAAAEFYLGGSTITIPAGAWQAGGSYHCTFDMIKTAGTGAIVITVRMGTLGTTGDTSIVTISYAAGTNNSEVGLFDVWITFRSVGSGSSAIIVINTRCSHNLAATGLTTTGAAGIAIPNPVLSSGFNSTTATKLGITFTGSTAFSGTNSFVQTEYKQ